MKRNDHYAPVDIWSIRQTILDDPGPERSGIYASINR
ncbi:hypothetical protein FHT82_003745 [Rhizobium sp. BK275]|nr:hypothetical protein [Rhizobium sp. BK275]